MNKTVKYASEIRNFVIALIAFTLLFTSITQTVCAPSKESDNPYFEMMMETEHFRVYFHPSNESVAAQIINVCEEVHSTLVEVYGGAPPTSTRIFIFNTYEELVSLGNPPSYLTKALWETTTGGCYTGGGKLGREFGEHIEAYNPNIGNEPMIKSFLGHEIGHRFFFYVHPHIRQPITPKLARRGYGCLRADKGERSCPILHVSTHR